MANVYPFEQNYRLTDRDPRPVEGTDITVTTEGDAAPEYDEATNTTVVHLPDGVVQVSFGRPQKSKETKDFTDNLAELLSESELCDIAEKLLRGIQQDEQSRSGWLDNMSEGISLLGLQIKKPAGAAASGATPAEGTSNVDHPLLLEAVLRFQANARGELLPADGPVKVRNDGEEDSLAARLAEALEKDMNHFLTTTAKEYVPDTDKMLLQLGFCGISFKKGYHDPIKRRPVIASIDAKDLIVSNASTNIEGAGRVTHRIMMSRGTLRRMQLLRAYRDVDLPAPGTPSIKNPVDSKIDQTQGIAPQTYQDPEDQDRELYECYCEIEVPGFEHKIDGQDSGLPLPYKVTIDKEARRILAIHRHWEEDDEFCMPKNNIIAYIFIPGLGFYGIGLLNILGNATKAVTAAWRLMIDAGMFANFPGFLYLKSLGKQLTNQFRVAPGTGMPVDTTGADIRSSIMPLPYKDPSAVFIQLIDNIATTAQRVGGTTEMQVGEGRQDAPVGTTLAMIEQATKLISAVHKRLHTAQSEEFALLKKLLMEDPSAVWRHNKKSKVLALLIQEAGQQEVVDQEMAAEERHKELFLTALADCELVPKADPNTSSQTERYLKIVAMRQMAATNPNIDIDKVDRFAFQTMGVDDGDDFFKPPPDPNAPPQPSPEQITAEATKTAAEADLLKAQNDQAKLEWEKQTFQQVPAETAATLASKEKTAAQDLARELVVHNADQEAGRMELGMKQQSEAANRVHKLTLAAQSNRHAAQQAAEDRAHQMQQTGLGLVHKSHESNLGRLHEAQQTGLAQRHELMTGGAAQYHEAAQGVADHHHEIVAGLIDKQHEHHQGIADRTHEAQKERMKLEYAARQAELDRKAKLEQIARQAKLRPKPAAPKDKKP